VRPAPRITLLSRPGCHLCAEARAVISGVAAELGITWEDRDISDSPDHLRQYSDMIPVTFVDGVQHDFWHVSADRLRAALLGHAEGSSGMHYSEEAPPRLT
jgi:glutaredoxin